MKNIYLIVGPSGVGKTTLVETLAREHDLKQVKSYTTRPPRYPGETSYIFVSDQEFNALGEMVAFTEYDGHQYGVTADIIDSHDLYVIDPYGVQHLKERYRGVKGIVVIKLYASPFELAARMKKRGDRDDQITKRLAVDAREFHPKRYDIRYDLTVHATSIQETADAVWEYIQYREKYDYMLKVYQIVPELDTERLIFADSEFLCKRQHRINPSVNLCIYDEVFSSTDNGFRFDSLEEIFAYFNSSDRPNRNTMRSISVSDVVEIRDHPDAELNGMWFCDSFGWKRIENGVILAI